MIKERPREIKAHHLARKAYVYIRQSTERQVLQNVGSTAYQRGQAEHARRGDGPTRRLR